MIGKLSNVEDSNEKIPEQQKGASSDIIESVNCDSSEAAVQLYAKARKNLFDINNWHQMAGKLSARFYLTDPSGGAADRLPLQGDFIKIHLPTSSADKFDWVRIENIEEEQSGDYSSRVKISVRPTDPPAPQQETEHFFTEDATSNFFVERKGRVVTAMVRGRNELPNTDTPGVVNKIRNAVIAVAAMAGLNTPQWKALVKGILETRDERR